MLARVIKRTAGDRLCPIRRDFAAVDTTPGDAWKILRRCPPTFPSGAPRTRGIAAEHRRHRQEQNRSVGREYLTEPGRRPFGRQDSVAAWKPDVMPRNDNNNSPRWPRRERTSERVREKERKRERRERDAGIFGALEVLEQNVAVV